MAIYYVDGASGRNSNPGSSSSPFQTIIYGVTGRVPGDTIYVRPGNGIYAESLDNVLPTGNASQQLTLARDPAYAFGTVTVRPASGIRALSLATPVSYITVSGFVMDAINVTSDCVKITGGANRITLADCELKNAPSGVTVPIGQGLLISGVGSDNNQILRCIIHDNGNYALEHQVYIRTNSNIIEGCEIYGGKGYGIHQYDGPPTGNVYRRNKIHNTDTGILLSSGSGNFAYYNLLYSNGIDIQVNYSEAGSKVWNNTCWGSTGGITLYAGVSNIEVKNNIGWLGTNYDFRDYGSTSPVVANNLFNIMQPPLADNLLGTDPLFVNAALRNFHLLTGSPAINAGTNLGLTLDYDGKPVGG